MKPFGVTCPNCKEPASEIDNRLVCGACGCNYPREASKPSSVISDFVIDAFIRMGLAALSEVLCNMSRPKKLELASKMAELLGWKAPEAN